MIDIMHGVLLQAKVPRLSSRKMLQLKVMKVSVCMGREVGRGNEEYRRNEE